ncbi:MAG: MipA/OmpV family protein [Pseudomonadota bacterium]
MIRFLAALALTTSAAFAQTAPSLDAPTVSTQGTGPVALGFTLRGGVATSPEFFGSDDNDVSPDIGFSLNYLRLGRFEIGNPDPSFERQGFGFTGSFRFIDERNEGDDVILDGLGDVDTSVELGLGVEYVLGNFEAFGAVRYGIIGHNGFVGEIGANLIARPTDRWTLRVGPRVNFGDDEFAEEYFGVTAGQAASSVAGLPEFDADGGLISAGIELGATYQINDRWGIEGAVLYDELFDDAEDSPITSDDSTFSARIGITRRFTLGF